VFSSEKAKCAVCHRVGQEGGQIGPDLTEIGRIRSRSDLLEAIVFPSSSFPREFQPYSVITVEGKVEHGTITRETQDMIYLQSQIGSPTAIPKKAIEEIAPSTVSIMPQGFDRILSPQELADLIAYLASLK
jgi:putative heme-binding domain-containing protein